MAKEIIDITMYGRALQEVKSHSGQSCIETYNTMVDEMVDNDLGLLVDIFRRKIITDLHVKP